jgi:hypothetical protein
MIFSSSGSSYTFAKACIEVFTDGAEPRCESGPPPIAVSVVSNKPAVDECNFNHFNTATIWNLVSFALWQAKTLALQPVGGLCCSQKAVEQCAGAGFGL